MLNGAIVISPFEHFSSVAQLLEELQPTIDTVNAVKAKLVAETGCTEQVAADFGVLAISAALMKIINEGPAVP